MKYTSCEAIKIVSPLLNIKLFDGYINEHTCGNTCVVNSINDEYFKNFTPSLPIQFSNKSQGYINCISTILFDNPQHPMWSRFIGVMFCIAAIILLALSCYSASCVIIMLHMLCV